MWFIMFIVVSRNPPEMTRATKNIAFKNQLRNFLSDENHLYGLILIHLASNVALKATKHLQVAGYIIFIKSPKTPILVSLTDHSHKPRAKRSSAQSPFYATTTNSPVESAFWGSDKCTPCAPCLFFYLQSGCLSSLSN